MIDTMTAATVRHDQPSQAEWQRGVQRVVLIRCGHVTTCVMELGPARHKISSWISSNAAAAEACARAAAIAHIDRITSSDRYKALAEANRHPIQQ